MAAMRLALSVRAFVAPLEPSGSIDARRSLAAGEDPLSLGARLHGRVQKRLTREDPLVQAEVPIQAELEYGEDRILVRGRLDVLVASQPPVVEEIKTSFRPAALLRCLAEEPDHPFALQAKMYAWLRLREDGQTPLCRIRVISLLDETETVVALPFDPLAFSAWVEGRLEALKQAWEKAQARKAERRALAAALTFPFPEPRAGQAELMALAASSLAEGKPMLLQAPTGLGKTAALLFPALARALEEDLRVFYCTPRNSQHEVAEDCVRRLRAHGAAVRSVTLKAKERVCPQPEVDCRPEVCPRALLYYDRLKSSGAVDTLLALGCADAPTTFRVAEEHLLCPYELALDTARQADVLIGDYNYVFSPASTLARFFGTPEESAKNVVLVDEAHNLPARAADWFSPALDAQALEALARKRALPRDRALRARLTRQIKRCLELLLAQDGPHRVVTLDPQPFLAEAFRIAKLSGEAAARGLDLKATHPLVELQRAWSDFCEVLKNLGPAHIVTWIPPGRLQITCADASDHLQGRLADLAGAVLFSATLKPFLYHQRLSGLAGREVVQLEVPSPFPPAHRKLLVVPQVSTLYRTRARETPRIAHFLERVLPLRTGNYFVFFPSFELLEQTLAHLHLPGFQVLAQPRRASASQIEALLGVLRSSQGVVVLAVQGGSLAEGIDLPGSALIGCVVVGPPLPPFDLEREQVRAYFQARYGCGQQYAYTFPAAAKAVQAAGRVIRTPEDRGLLIFLDGRFLERDFADCFPQGWFQGSPAELVSGAILAEVAAFWGTAGVS
jgi:DNA excision repair protein ERCC-2